MFAAKKSVTFKTYFLLAKTEKFFNDVMKTKFKKIESLAAAFNATACLLTF